MDIFDLPTPSILVDLDILQRNIHSMQQRANEASVKLRPHVKTHKSKKILQMQLEAGAHGITCAKVSEAETMVGEAKDILIAYPIIGDEQLGRAVALMQRSRIILAFDSIYGAEKINEFARENNRIINLYIIINTGGDRDGVKPGGEALELAMATKEYRNINIVGIMTHEGHLYSTEKVRLQSEMKNVYQAMLSTGELLRKNGFDIEEISTGSTPGCLSGIVAEGITEWRPGTYVFNDIQESMLVTSVENCALTVLATVVGQPTDTRYILDAGSKTLTVTDHPEIGYGLIKSAPNAKIEKLSEEHAVVHAPKDSLCIGQKIEIIPNHVCPVVNLTDYFYVVKNKTVIDQWRVDARGKVV